MNKNESYKVIGLMSGTSLDGLDIAFCTFSFKDERWEYQVVEAVTEEYSYEWLSKLNGAFSCNGRELTKLNFEYGHYLGKAVKKFCHERAIEPDFISSHGHTLFHMPSEGYTLQIGHGAAIAASSGIRTVCDFRSGDVALNGQGAPLVPAGDALLFSEYSKCLNLGGFANVSYGIASTRVAFDICPVNIVLNQLTQSVGKKYDDKGNIARSGKLNMPLFEKLNDLGFYKTDPPKSLGREWVDINIIPLLESSGLSLEDKLHTTCEHAAFQTGKYLNDGETLVTGGGAYNHFLMERIKSYSQGKITIPEKKIIEFKEALIFAFLGVLRIREEINSLRSVTGAEKDSCGGAIYLSPDKLPDPS